MVDRNEKIMQNLIMNKRIYKLFNIFVIAFVIIMLRHAQITILKADALARAETNRRWLDMEKNTPRGSILDRNGIKLGYTEDKKRIYKDYVSSIIGYQDVRFGRAGIEKDFNEELTGISREFDVEEFTRLLHKKEKRGADIKLTLDYSLQEKTSKALSEKRGAIVLINPETGEILALATNPTFNFSEDDFEIVQKKGDGILLNRAINFVYPPGSSAKILTAAAALTNGVKMNHTLLCEGVTIFKSAKITDYHKTAHGEIDMPNAFKKSCNLYFGALAIEMGSRHLINTGKKFGMGEDIRSHYADERVLPRIAVSSIAKDDAKIYNGDLSQLGFGQSTFSATPFQMALIAGAVANGGKLMKPYLVKSMIKDNEEISLFKEDVLFQPITAEIAQDIERMMWSVVNEGGTGTRAKTRGLRVYGKTGTAEHSKGEDHAWFVGYAKNSKDETIAFAVIIERGGSGGANAASVIPKILDDF